MDKVIARRKVRLSEHIDSLIVLLQLLLLARIGFLIAGIGDQRPYSYLIDLTSWLIRPLYPLFPPAQVGPYILEPASAFLVLALTLTLGLTTRVLDAWRKSQRWKSVRRSF